MLQQCSIVPLNRKVIYAKILSPLSVSRLSFPQPFSGLRCPARGFHPGAILPPSFQHLGLFFDTLSSALSFVQLHHLVAFHRSFFFLFSSPTFMAILYYFLIFFYVIFIFILIWVLVPGRWIGRVECLKQIQGKKIKILKPQTTSRISLPNYVSFFHGYLYERNIELLINHNKSNK